MRHGTAVVGVMSHTCMVGVMGRRQERDRVGGRAGGHSRPHTPYAPLGRPGTSASVTAAHVLNKNTKPVLFWFILFYSGVTLVGTADAAGVKSAFSSRSSSFSFFLSSL